MTTFFRILKMMTWQFFLFRTKFSTRWALVNSIAKLLSPIWSFKSCIYFYIFYRLTPSYLFLIFFVTYLFPLFGNGPFWTGSIERNYEKYWWTNILYINNVYPDQTKVVCTLFPFVRSFVRSFLRSLYFFFIKLFFSYIYIYIVLWSQLVLSEWHAILRNISLDSLGYVQVSLKSIFVFFI